MVPTPKASIGGFFRKKSFSWGKNFLWGVKIYGEVILNGWINDQIMPGGEGVS